MLNPDNWILIGLGFITYPLVVGLCVLAYALARHLASCRRKSIHDEAAFIVRHPEVFLDKGWRP